MNLKRIIREEINNDLDWINNVKSNQDIAQEIADETQIKNNRLFTPFFSRPFSFPLPFFFSPLSLPTSFTKHCKDVYGLDEMDANDVWERYKDIIINIYNINNLNESKNKLIKESGVENYIQSIASITSGNQKIYYDWLLSNLENVSVVSYRSNEELKEKVDRFVKKMRRFGDFCEKKGCFDTAYNTAMYVPGVHYIEGYVQSMIPLVHAWNYLPEEGIYFDLINDIAWKEEDSHFNEYYKVIDLDKSGVLKWSSKTGYGGGFIESPQFIEEVIKKSVK